MKYYRRVTHAARKLKSSSRAIFFVLHYAYICASTAGLSVPTERTSSACLGRKTSFPTFPMHIKLQDTNTTSSVLMGIIPVKRKKDAFLWLNHLPCPPVRENYSKVALVARSLNRCCWICCRPSRGTARRVVLKTKS